MWQVKQVVQIRVFIKIAASVVLLGKDKNMGSQRREKLCSLVLMAKLPFVLKINYKIIIKVKKRESIPFTRNLKERILYDHTINIYVLIRNYFMWFTLWAEFILIHF